MTNQMYQKKESLLTESFSPISPQDLSDYFKLNGSNNMKEHVVESVVSPKLRQGQKLKQPFNYQEVIYRLAKDLHTKIDMVNIDHSSGIDGDENQKRKRALHFGVNQLKTQKSNQKVLEEIKRSFKNDSMIRVLSFAAIISLILGMITEGIEEGWIDGASILFGVVIIVVVNSYVRVKINTIGNGHLDKMVKVIRDGSQEAISSNQILVGDLIKIEMGQTLPVDGILILKNEDKVIVSQQYILQGKQNVQAEKSRDSPFVVSGSSIISIASKGDTLMMVLAVGKHSFYHKPSVRMGMKTQSPLYKKIILLINRIKRLGTYCAVAIFGLMAIRYVIDCIKHPESLKAFFRFKTLDEMVEYFVLSIGIKVISIPEGLPLAVTATLGYSIKRMKCRSIDVRHLEACEALGAITNLVVDKTGILTTTHMQVNKLYMFDHLFQSPDKIQTTVPPKQLDILNTVIRVTSSNFQKQDACVKRLEDRLSEALLTLIKDSKRQCLVNRKGYIKTFPFDTERKISTVIYEEKQSPSNIFKTYICSKGMPTSLLAQCSHYINSSYAIVPITPQYIQKIEAQSEDMSKKQSRVTLLAYSISEDLEIPSDRKMFEKNMICLGIVGITDPFKEQIENTLKELRRAGINLTVITGEPGSYAASIAKTLELLPPDENYIPGPNEILEGEQLREMVGPIIDKGKESQTIPQREVFQKISTELKILSKASSEDRYLLVAGLQSVGNIVATILTGDNYEDLAVLAKAHIGISVKENVIREIQHFSDIHFQNRSLESMLVCVKEGRTVFSIIRKVLIYQLTINIVALTMAFIGGYYYKESPLSSVQVLWVNIIINTLASYAFANQEPNNEVLNNKPFSEHEQLINKRMWIHILAQSLVQVCLLSVILFKLPEWLQIPQSMGFEGWNQDSGRHYAIFFNVFVYLQIFNQLNTRIYESQSINIFAGVLSNMHFIKILLITLSLQMIVSQIGGEATRVVNLSFQEILLCVIFGSVSLITSVIIKTVMPLGLIQNIESEQIRVRRKSFSFLRFNRQNTEKKGAEESKEDPIKILKEE